MRIGRVEVEQRAGEAVEQLADGRRLGRIVEYRMQRQPGLAHSGEFANREFFHSRILEQLDQRHLHRQQLLHRQRVLREHQMRGAMVGGGAVDLERADDLPGRSRIALGFVVVIGVRDIDDIMLDVRLEPFAAFVIAGGRSQKKIAAPDRAHVDVEPPLDVDEQRALALLLQHRLRVGALQPEIGRLPFEIGFVRLRAPLHPAAQASQRKLIEQAIEVFQHRPQAARSLRRHDLQHLQIVAKQIGIAHAMRHQRRGADDQRQHLPRGLGRHAQQEVDQIG